MAVTCSTQAKDKTNVERWKADLEEQIAAQESWGEDQDTETASIILRMFLAFEEKGYLAAQQAALQIGADYWAKYLPSSQDPLHKPYMLRNKGWPTYLRELYHVILSQSWLQSYFDPRQDLLVRLLIELRELPKVTYQDDDYEYHPYHNDPVFGMMCEDEWNGKFPSDHKPEPEDPKEKEEFVRECDEWVNFSSFQARIVGAKVYKPWETYLKYPSVDIEVALEKDLPSGKLAECRLLVASEWIIHAGKVIYDDMKKTNKEKWGPPRWKSWAGSFEEILKAGGHSEEVTVNLQAALDEMISIDTESVGGD
ncbi:hypothetical protein CGLO_13959 [Colletotrichum gloeosporioides Cg-14]|uniref:Uncharacterized protein n=1 Tax=Colletotrichum gloeosporioides (strain Cg-14) TaxID=1237896 RepID=T0L5Z0_COLGC|nr:hypothetical protein CGLO_13959 [Colletotrichum gloeosporioides Cg-14]